MRLIGTANASSPGRSPVATARPTTWPAVSITGPPELPRWMRASIWRNVRKPIALAGTSDAAASRPVAETIPTAAVTSSPKGLPRTTVHSPTLSRSESPSWSARTRGRSIDRSATCRSLSRPISFAGPSRPSARTTRKSSAAAAIASLVRTYGPLCSITKPVPIATSDTESGVPGNIAAGPLFTGAPDRIATIAPRASATRSTNDPGAVG